jgi:D-methionine transport system substrate-binding protein
MKSQLHEKILRCVCLSAFILTVVGCKSHSADVLRIGVTPGPAEEILHAVEPAMAEQGIKIKIIRFSDYIQPDMALASHDLDANLYQNIAFLNQFDRDHQTNFISLTRVYLPLMAIYPGRSKSLASIGHGERIAIPNDPVNHDRALLLLQKAGLLQLAQDASKNAVRVTANPLQLKLVELDAAQLPRSLDDVDAAVINANFALDAGLNPHTGSLLSETRDSPYANVLSTNADAAQNAAAPGARQGAYVRRDAQLHLSSLWRRCLSRGIIKLCFQIHQRLRCEKSQSVLRPVHLWHSTK